MKKLLLLMLTALLFAACSNGPKILVLYYSQSNTTKTVAQEFQKQLGCDIAEIECEEPYVGDFGAVAQRWQKEQQEGKTAAIKPLSKTSRTTTSSSSATQSGAARMHRRWLHC
jgi:cytochrome c oxidase assembly factor CtaG